MILPERALKVNGDKRVKEFLSTLGWTSVSVMYVSRE